MNQPGRKGNVIVYTGPSGVGKGTVICEVLKRHDDIVFSVSATTRNPRPGEVNGVNYYFVSKEDFLKLVEEGKMLEWAEFAGNYYGTFSEAVDKEIKQGKDVVLEIEVKGAMQVKDKVPEAKLVFIAPPSFEELQRRLTGRGTEPEDVIQKRLQVARDELAQKDAFDYVIVNDDLETTIKKVEKVILDLREV